MTLKRFKRGLGTNKKMKGGYLIMYFPGVGVVSVRAELVVCAKSSDDANSLLDEKGKPTKKAKLVTPSADEIREGKIAYRSLRRVYGIYVHGEPRSVEEVFDGLFAFVPFLDLNFEARLLAAFEAHETTAKS